MVRIIKFGVLAVFSCLAIYITVFILTGSKPPVRLNKSAREAITEARLNNAHIYSPEKFNAAISKYDSAILCWQHENQRFILFRNFEKAEQLAAEAREYAYNAFGHAIANSLQIEEDLKCLLDSLSSIIQYFQMYFEWLPLNNNVREQTQLGQLLYNEARIAFEKGDLATAGEKTDLADRLISDSYKRAEKLLNDYFLNHSEWKKWAERTVDLSRKNKSYCILIDKFSRECLLYRSGKLKNKFPVELGKNWIGDKNQQGDKSTPEGNYKIVGKYTGSQTKYYKALLIDYPNEDDVKRFTINKKNGIISSDAAIGSLIEIHGQGGKGVDWTDGCIALANDDIDILFSSCPVGTRVTIVGSIKSLSEVLN